MSENSYQVLGAGIAKMFGRERDWAALMRRLKKQTPDHVSVIGPQYIGKTVFLRAIADYFAQNQEHFAACLYWNVRHSRIETDADFFDAFCKEIAKSIRPISSEIADYLQLDETSFELINDAFDSLHKEQKKVLVIMDGLDNLLSAGGLSKNVWDNLRSLGDKFSSITFLMGSRKPLDEICSTVVRTSPFWNLFAPPIKLQAFDDNDFENLFVPFKDRKIEASFRARLHNYSGGIPVLSSALCQSLWEFESIGEKEIEKAMDALLDDRVKIFDDLWNDCNDEEQIIITALTEKEMNQAEISQPCFQSLKQRGFVRVEEDKVSLCPVVKKYVKDYRRHATDFKRLFGAADDFNRNIKDVLEMRFKQIENVDEILAARLQMLIQNIHETVDFIESVRRFSDRSLQMIWDSEIPDGNIPSEWVRVLYLNYTSVPTDNRGRQCNLLDKITKSSDISTKVSRATYVLINSIKEAGDFGQHLNGANVPVSFCAAVCLSAIELCENLSKELS